MWWQLQVPSIILELESRSWIVSVICDAVVPTEFVVAKAQGYRHRGSGYEGVRRVILEVLQSVEWVTTRR